MTRSLHGLRVQAAHAVTYATVTLMLAGPARAAGSSMPWEAPLQSILESIEGPVAKIIAVIIIIVTGLTLAFGDTSGGFRRLGRAARSALRRGRASASAAFRSSRGLRARP